MSLISRITTWASNQLLTSSSLNGEFNNIVNVINNLDSGTTKWDLISILNASSVPLTVDNSSGSQDIADFKANGSIVVSIGPTGALKVGGGIIGTTTNDNATSGNVGQIVSSVVTSYTNFAASTVFGDLTSIIVPAGDWDLSVLFNATANGATVTQTLFGVATASGSSSTGFSIGDSGLIITNPTSSGGDSGASMPPYRVSLAAQTTYYLKFRATFTVATPQAVGRISARRVR